MIPEKIEDNNLYIFNRIILIIIIILVLILYFYDEIIIFLIRNGLGGWL